jgi:hypothetical protein
LCSIRGKRGISKETNRSTKGGAQITNIKRNKRYKNSGEINILIKKGEGLGSDFGQL